MGFGSYDESEQESQAVDADDNEDEAISVHENDHDGEMTVESSESTEALLGQLEEIKEQSGE